MGIKIIPRTILIEPTFSGRLPAYNVQYIGFDDQERGEVLGFVYLVALPDSHEYAVMGRWSASSSLSPVERKVGTFGTLDLANKAAYDEARGNAGVLSEMTDIRLEDRTAHAL